MNWLHQITTRTIAVAGLAVCGALITSASMTVASTTTLKTVTNSDKTASVGLPDGWKLAKGSNGYIYVTGPNDDRINLGASIVAKNAPAGTSVGGGAVFALPYSASLKDKYTTIVQIGAAQQGLPKLQLTFASQTPTKLPMCARLLGSSTGGGQSRKFEAVLCSLQPDYLGFYKNIVFLANIPSNRVSQDRAIVEQIVSSYRLTPDMFKKLLSSYTPLPPHPAAGISGAVSGMAPYEDPTNSDCFDYNVIRESPPWEVPMHCGGTKPG
ncbi:MAG TPA: hypothetical protein VII69_02110 [Candidatus Eremiobacteraceae bacterium]